MTSQNEKPASAQPRVRVEGNHFTGELVWAHDPFFRPLIGFFASGKLERVEPTFRRRTGSAGGSWVCHFAAQFDVPPEAKGTIEVMCLETGEVLYNDRSSIALRTDGTLDIFDLIEIADANRTPWDSGGFLEFLEFSIADQVDLLYRSVLNRSADPDGLNSFSTQIRNGELTILDLRDMMSRSQEFKENVQSTVYSQLGQWIVWGGLAGVSKHFALEPSNSVNPLYPDDDILMPLNSFSFGSLECIAEKISVRTYLSSLALGSQVEIKVRRDWEAEHDGHLSAATKRIEARRSSREETRASSGSYKSTGMLSVMRAGTAGRELSGRFCSRPDTSGFVVYGPYMRISPGRYRLAIQLHCKARPGKEPPRLFLEVVYDSLLLSGREIDLVDFSLASHHLDFEVPAGISSISGSQYEFRLVTNGASELELLDMQYSKMKDVAIGARDLNVFPILSVGSAGVNSEKGIFAGESAEGHVFYGPYRSLLPGRYVVVVEYEGYVVLSFDSLTLEAVDAATQMVISSRHAIAERGSKVLELFFIVQNSAENNRLPNRLEFRLWKKLGVSLVVTSVRVRAIPDGAQMGEIASSGEI